MGSAVTPVCIFKHRQNFISRVKSKVSTLSPEHVSKSWKGHLTDIASSLPMAVLSSISRVYFYSCNLYRQILSSYWWQRSALPYIFYQTQKGCWCNTHPHRAFVDTYVLNGVPQLRWPSRRDFKHCSQRRKTQLWWCETVHLTLTMHNLI